MNECLRKKINEEAADVNGNSQTALSKTQSVLFEVSCLIGCCNTFFLLFSCHSIIQSQKALISCLMVWADAAFWIPRLWLFKQPLNIAAGIAWQDTEIASASAHSWLWIPGIRRAGSVQITGGPWRCSRLILSRSLYVTRCSRCSIGVVMWLQWTVKISAIHTNRRRCRLIRLCVERLLML